MTGEELYTLLGREPFQPVRVILRDGTKYPIIHRQLAIVGETFVHIGIQQRKEKLPIWDELVTVDLDQVDRVEPLAAKLPKTNGKKRKRPSK